MKVVHRVDGISFVYFDDKDVVRNRIVQLIVKAYEAYGLESADEGARPRSA